MGEKEVKIGIKISFNSSILKKKRRRNRQSSVMGDK